MFVYQINLFYDPDGVVENAARRARESIICEVIDLLDMLDWCNVCRYASWFTQSQEGPLRGNIQVECRDFSFDRTGITTAKGKREYEHEWKVKNICKRQALCYHCFEEEKKKKTNQSKVIASQHAKTKRNKTPLIKRKKKKETNGHHATPLSIPPHHSHLTPP